jgi:uncharacterized membrane protein YfcA
MATFPFETVAVTLFISFFCVVSFAITSFGGAIIFQLGWSICSLASDRVCGSDLAIPLAMMSIGAFLQLPLQVVLLWRYVNIPLAIRFTVYQSIGTLLGVFILTKYGTEASLRQLLGFFLLAVATWFFWKESRHNPDEISHAIDNTSQRTILLQKVQSLSSFKPLRLISLIGEDSDGDTNTSDLGNHPNGSVASKVLNTNEESSSLPQESSFNGRWSIRSALSGLLSVTTFGLISDKTRLLYRPASLADDEQGVLSDRIAPSYEGCNSSSGGSSPFVGTTETRLVASADSRPGVSGEYVSFSVAGKGTASSVPPVHGHTLRRLSATEIGQFEVKSWLMEFYIMVAGATAGILGGLYGTSGPPLMIFVCAFGIDKDEWRATTSVAHLFENLVRSYVVLYVEKVVDVSQNWYFVLGYVFTLAAGLIVGDALAHHVNTSLWRQILLFFMMCSSSTLITAGYNPLITLLAFTVTMMAYVLLYCFLRRRS